MTAPGQLPARICAVVSALGLVFAFALATLFPPMLSLAEFIALIDHAALVGLQNFLKGHVSSWLWTSIAMPILVRPSWLLPVTIGLVAGGAAITFSSNSGAARSRRRRS